MSQYDPSKIMERRPTLEDIFGIHSLVEQSQNAMGDDCMAAIIAAQNARKGYNPTKRPINERICVYVEKTLPGYLKELEEYVPVKRGPAQTESKKKYACKILEITMNENDKLLKRLSMEEELPASAKDILRYYLRRSFETFRIKVDKIENRPSSKVEFLDHQPMKKMYHTCNG